MSKYDDFDLDIQNIKVNVGPPCGWTSIYKCDVSDPTVECYTTYCDTHTCGICAA